MHFFNGECGCDCTMFEGVWVWGSGGLGSCEDMGVGERLSMVQGCQVKELRQGLNVL